MRLKRLISSFVMCAMLVTLMPMQAFAVDDAGEATTWTKELSVDELYHAVQDQLDENNAIALEDLTAIEAIASDVRDDVTGQLTAIAFDDQQVVLAELDDTTSYTLTFAEEDNADAAPAEPDAQPSVESDAGEPVTVPSEPAANNTPTENPQTTGPPAEPEVQSDVSLTVTEKEIFTTEAEAEEQAQKQGVDPAAVSTETSAEGQVLGATLTVNETEVSKMTLTYEAEAETEEDPFADFTVVEDTESYTEFTPSMLEEMGISLKETLDAQELAELLGNQGNAAIEVNGTAYAFEADSALTLTVDWENDWFIFEGEEVALLVDFGMSMLGSWRQPRAQNWNIPGGSPEPQEPDVSTAADLDKTAVLGKTAGTWDVTLTAELKGSMEPEKLELALVVDVSYSMTKERFANVRTAMTALLENLVERGLNVDVSITKFGKEAKVTTDLTTLTGQTLKSTFTDAIEDIDFRRNISCWGTNIESGLIKAATDRNALSASPNQKAIILLTDSDGWSETGDGSEKSDTDIAIAQSIINHSISLYGVKCFTRGRESNTWNHLREYLNGSYEADDADELSAAFDNIANTLSAMITDPMGPNVKLVGNVTVQDNNAGKYGVSSNDTITWNPNDDILTDPVKVKIQYTVQPTEVEVTGEEGKTLPLNGEAQLKYYWEEGEAQKYYVQNFPVPHGFYTAGQLNQEFWLDDGTSGGNTIQTERGDIQYLSWGIGDKAPKSTDVTEFKWTAPDKEKQYQNQTIYYQYSYRKDDPTKTHIDKTSIPAVAEDVTIVHVYAKKKPLQNGTPITVQVYRDDEQVNADEYITVANNGTTDLSGTADGNSIKINYKYEQYNCADFQITSKNSDLILQAIEATLMVGSSGGDGIGEKEGVYTLDNVQGGSTVKVYFYTPYHVEYYQNTDKLTTAPYNDSNVYFVTKAKIAQGEAPEYDSADPNHTASGAVVWTDGQTYNTSITLPILPSVTGHTADGWYLGSAANTTSKYAENIGFTAINEVSDNAGNDEDDNIIKFYATSTAKQYNLIYQWSGLPENAGIQLPAGSSYAYGTPVTLDTQYTRGTTHKIGHDTYTFSGWTVTPELGAGDTMPANHVTVSGTWTLTYSDPQYPVTYEVIDNNKPATSTDLPAEVEYYEGDPVAVAAALTTEETTRNGINGVWTFNGWTTSDATINNDSFTMPDKAVTLTGSWTFTPNQHTITIHYQDKTGNALKTDYTDTKDDGFEYSFDVSDNAEGAIPFLITKDGTQYVFDHFTVDFANLSGTLTSNITITAVYLPDANKNKTPDAYEATVTYKIMNGTWDGSDATDKKAYFALKTFDKDSNTWVEVVLPPTLGHPTTGTVFPITGMKPDTGYIADGAAWDNPTIDAQTNAMDGAIYTYTFPTQANPALTIEKVLQNQPKALWLLSARR